MQYMEITALRFATEVQSVEPPAEWLDHHDLDGTEILAVYDDGSVECDYVAVLGFGEIAVSTWDAVLLLEVAEAVTKLDGVDVAQDIDGTVRASCSGSCAVLAPGEASSAADGIARILAELDPADTE